MATRIAIAGAAGRMGRNLVVACSETDDLELTQALEREQSPSIGSDTGLLAGLAPNKVLLGDHLDASAFDMLDKVELVVLHHCRIRPFKIINPVSTIPILK